MEFMMDLKEAQLSLENELEEPLTDMQKPLTYKYSKWKIIDYLWTSFLKGVSDGDSVEWLKKLYSAKGMEEENLKTFTQEIELLLEVIKRNPLKK